MKFNPLAWLFKFISWTVNDAEKSVLDLLSAIVPYFVPVIPAYLTFVHTTEQMNFDTTIGWTAAFVVEVLGLTSVSTAIKFYRHNRRYRDEKNKAPFWLAVGVYVFYLVVVMAVNVILEMVARERGGWVIFSIALFTLLSVPSGVLISIRAQYSEMLEEKTARYPRPAPAGTTEKKPRRARHASHYREKIVSMLDERYNADRHILSPSEITARLNLDHGKAKGFISSLTSQWIQKRGHTDTRKSSTERSTERDRKPIGF